MTFENNIGFAVKEDEDDSLKDYRKRFYIPRNEDKEIVYLCGHSLGLQPKSAEQFLSEELKDWAELGVEGHFKTRNPWADYHKLVANDLSRLVGAGPDEVVAMNSLTVNLHLMLHSFYRPDGVRRKILTEYSPFSSDYYALESVLKFYGIDPSEGIVEMVPDEGEFLISPNAVLQQIAEHADALAMVLVSPVNYLTGQYFNIREITSAAHSVGAIAGFDLAHTIGNIPLKLHEWEADFAVWCSYKYLNSGPGGVGGAFIHEKHGKNPDIPRLSGWWGHQQHTRFRMEKGFIPMEGAEGWQLSNAPVLSLAVQRASLKIFSEAGIENLRAKSIRLTSYLEFLLLENIINKENKYGLSVITPSDPDRRGCQLSLIFLNNARDIFLNLTKADFRVDFREPGIIRVTPSPLYNSYQDVFRFVHYLSSL